MTWEDGEPTLGSVYTPKLETLLGPTRRQDDDLQPKHEAIAASLQAVFERAALHVLRHVQKSTRSTKLCFAGGCAMNSVLNGKIRERTPFREVYIQAAAGDNGTSLGAALYVWHQVLRRPRRFVGGREPNGSYGVLWLTPRATEMTETDWNFPEGRFICYVLGPLEAGKPPLYIVLNAAPEEIEFLLPPLPGVKSWTLLLDTAPQSETGQEFPAGAKRTAVRDRSRTIGRKIRELTRTLRRRTGEAKAEVLELTKQTGTMLRKSVSESDFDSTTQMRTSVIAASTDISGRRLFCLSRYASTFHRIWSGDIF